MIRYTLVCEHGHQFESWFRSSDAYDELRAAGQVACAICGSDVVEKALMAPDVATVRKADLHSPRNPREAALDKLRQQIEASSDYVGLSFAAEARAIHDGLAPERAIHGEARPDEARKLIEDGIPVAPLPFLPRKKAN